jgi:N-acetyltransferase
MAANHLFSDPASPGQRASTSIFQLHDLALLRGHTIFLEPIAEQHREVLRPLARDERIWEATKTLLIDATYDQQFDQNFNEAMATAAAGGQGFIIRATIDDAPIGMTRIHMVDKPNKALSIGWTWYIPAVWGKVHNKECKLLLLRYVFETLHFNRAEFKVVHQNIRSQKAVEKIGGVKEGVLRKTGYRNDGTTKDTVMYSIIDEEWPGKKEKLLELVKEYLAK